MLHPFLTNVHTVHSSETNLKYLILFVFIVMVYTAGCAGSVLFTQMVNLCMGLQKAEGKLNVSSIQETKDLGLPRS